MSTDPSRVWIRRASTAAGLAYTAIAEYELARRLGAQPFIAVMLPLSIDCYVIAALKWFKALDVALSLILMCAAQVAAHALDAGVVPVSLELVTVVSVLVPVALWRTHALARGESAVPEQPVEDASPPTVERVSVPVDTPPVPEAYPEIEAPVPAVPEAVPAGTRMLPVFECRGELRRALRNETPLSVLGAEQPHTRPEVHGYAPETQTDAVPAVPLWDSAKDELGWAAMQFKDELLAGRIPGIARIKSECRVGQDRAKELQDGLREAQAAWRLAGSVATS